METRHMKYLLATAAVIIGCFSIAGIVYAAGYFDRESNNDQLASAVSQLIDPGPPAPLPTELDPNFLTQINSCFLPTAAVHGYNLRITSGFRTFEEQQELYEQGRTIDGHIVTNAQAGRSIHNFGFAVDVVDRAKGYDIDWKKLGEIGAYCGLRQGRPGDYSHFEYRGGLNTYQLERGMRPKPLVLPCQAMEGHAQLGKAVTAEDLKSCGAPTF